MPFAIKFFIGLSVAMFVLIMWVHLIIQVREWFEEATDMAGWAMWWRIAAFYAVLSVTASGVLTAIAASLDKVVMV